MIPPRKVFKGIERRPDGRLLNFEAHFVQSFPYKNRNARYIGAPSEQEKAAKVFVLPVIGRLTHQYAYKLSYCKIILNVI